MDNRIIPIVQSLHNSQFYFNTEKELQEGISQVLSAKKIPFEREFKLGDSGTIDFLICGSIGLEVKTGGTWVGIIRQLMRYASSDIITSIILISRKSVFSKVPNILRRKPVYVVDLWKSAL